MIITKADIDRPFKLNGLFLAPDASAYLLQIIQRIDASKQQKVLKRLVDTILKQRIDDSRITKALCELAVNECKADHNVNHPVLFVIDAFSLPRFYYSQSVKKFVPLESSNFGGEFKSLFPATAQLKSFLYANRYEVVHQHVLRHQLFSQSAMQANSVVSNSASYRIQPVEFLLSSGSRVDVAIVLGMLCQPREGEWHLEDPTGIVRLSLVGTTFHEGLFPEGCIVLVEGWYEDNVLHVTDMGLPPCEPSETSRRAFSIGNPFGGGSSDFVSAEQDTKMFRLLTTTQAGADAMLVILGETQLDKPECMDKLNMLFTGYSAYPPVAFILTGNFLSSDSSGRTCPERLCTLRQLLHQVIVLFRNSFPDIQSNQPTSIPHLVLVPGPEDPVCAPSHLLPKPGFPVELVLDLSADIRRSTDNISSVCPAWLHLTSNPCRIRLYTREIVVFRSEYSRLLLRHCIHLPTVPNAVDDAVSETVDLDSENLLSPGVTPATQAHKPLTATQSKTRTELLGMGLARCLASQAHLLPLMGHIAPVYWAYDQALSLHPLPDLVVAVEPHALADLNAAVSDPVKTGGCRFINPGQFGRKVATADSVSPLRTEYSFKVYYPRNGVVENSCLPD